MASGFILVAVSVKLADWMGAHPSLPTALRGIFGSKYFAYFPSVDMPLSTLKASVARVLKEEGYIEGFETVNEGPQGVLKIQLKSL